MSAGKKSKSAKTKRSKGDSSKKTVDVATDALSRCNSLKPPPPAVVVDSLGFRILFLLFLIKVRSFDIATVHRKPGGRGISSALLIHTLFRVESQDCKLPFLWAYPAASGSSDNLFEAQVSRGI